MNGAESDRVDGAIIIHVYGSMSYLLSSWNICQTGDKFIKL
jgi:hypothetical protein